jgi:hypothetical protein
VRIFEQLNSLDLLVVVGWGLVRGCESSCPGCSFGPSGFPVGNWIWDDWFLFFVYSGDLICM